MVALRQKFKDEGNDLLQNIVKSNMNILFGVPIRKNNKEPYKCISHNWMETEHDDNDLDYGILPNKNYIVKFKKKRWFRR